MAVYYGIGTAARGTSPAGMARGDYQGARARVYTEVIDLAAQAVITTADTIVVALPTIGERFVWGQLTASATMGASATLAVGIAGTTGKYRTAAVFTAVETPTLFGAGAAGLALATKLTTNELVYITIAVASLPAAGILRCDMCFAQT